MAWALLSCYWVYFFSSGANLIILLIKRFRPMILIKYSALFALCTEAGGFTGAIRKNISDECMPDDD
jgi:hypothetical protein